MTTVAIGLIPGASIFFRAALRRGCWNGWTACDSCPAKSRKSRFRTCWPHCAALDGEADRKTFFVKSARCAEQEMDLLARAVETDGAAELQEFILSHRQLVTLVRTRYRRLYGGSVEDAEQAGMLGLIYATFHYQPCRGFQL